MKSVRLGIVGLGNMGSHHAQNVIEKKVPNVELTAVCDIAPNLGERFPHQKIFRNPEEMFASGEIDAVYIATPHYAHTTVGIAALKAGLHVLVEKPISVHKADCERLLAAHEDKNLVFAAVFNLRTLPLYKKLKSLIDQGELGEIRRIHWTITDWFRTQAYYNSGTWRGTWKGEGGGVLLNQCPHQLDLWQWLFGMPERIYARCSFGRYHDIEVEDDVTAVLEYPEGKTGIFVASTGEAPGTNRLEIVGERGKLVVENSQISFVRNEVEMTKHSHEAQTRMGGSAVPAIWNVEIPVPESQTIATVEIMSNFIRAITQNEPLIAPASEGIHSVELGNAMLLSTLQDQAVRLPIDGKVFENALQELIQNTQS